MRQLSLLKELTGMGYPSPSGVKASPLEWNVALPPASGSAGSGGSSPDEYMTTRQWDCALNPPMRLQSLTSAQSMHRDVHKASCLSNAEGLMVQAEKYPLHPRLLQSALRWATAALQANITPASSSRSASASMPAPSASSTALDAADLVGGRLGLVLEKDACLKALQVRIVTNAVDIAPGGEPRPDVDTVCQLCQGCLVQRTLALEEPHLLGSSQGSFACGFLMPLCCSMAARSGLEASLSSCSALWQLWRGALAQGLR